MKFLKGPISGPLFFNLCITDLIYFVVDDAANLRLYADDTMHYYMAKPVLGKCQRSDCFFLGRDFAVRTISVETVQAVYFCFGAKPENS